MFRTSLCPSSGEQDRVLPRMMFCTSCGCVELGCRHTACDPAPHNHNQHNQCRTPYAVVRGLVLLMMGIMMPETCWDRSLIIKIRLVASCWFLSLHPTMRCLLITTICFATTFSCKYYIQRVVFDLVIVHSVQQRLTIIHSVPHTDF